MTSREALAFVARHGIVLEAGKGPVPSLSERVMGIGVFGGWWSHPKGHEFFGITRSLRDSRELVVCRLVGNKITYVHRRFWPALYRLRRSIGAGRLASIREEHTAAGRHKLVRQSFSSRIGVRARAAGNRMTVAEARKTLQPVAAALRPNR